MHAVPSALPEVPCPPIAQGGVDRLRRRLQERPIIDDGLRVLVDLGLAEQRLDPIEADRVFGHDLRPLVEDDVVEAIGRQVEPEIILEVDVYREVEIDLPGVLQVVGLGEPARQEGRVVADRRLLVGVDMAAVACRGRQPVRRLPVGADRVQVGSAAADIGDLQERCLRVALLQEAIAGGHRRGCSPPERNRGRSATAQTDRPPNTSARHPGRGNRASRCLSPAAARTPANTPANRLNRAGTRVAR